MLKNKKRSHLIDTGLTPIALPYVAHANPVIETPNRKKNNRLVCSESKIIRHITKAIAVGSKQ